MLSVTVTLTLQEAPPAIVPPVSEKLVDPAVAPVTVPPHVFVKFGVAAITTPVGSGSGKPTFVKAVFAFRFVIVTVKVEVPPCATLVGLKVFRLVGR